MTSDGITAGENILIVVPCLNERENLSNVLNALLADPANSKALIAVVDGGTADGTIEIANAAAEADPRVVLLHNPAKLQGAAVNLAVSQLGSHRDWLVRVDAHCGYPSDFVSRLLATAHRNGADSVVVPILSRAEGCFQRAVAAAQNSLLGSGGAAHRRTGYSGWVDHGHHALFRLEKYVQAGGYDNSFAANEDAEFDLRLAEVGGVIWLDDDGAIEYFPRRSPRKLFSQYLKYGSGRARTQLRHRTPLKIRQILPLFVAPAVLLLFPAPWLPLLAIPGVTWIIICLAFGAWIGRKGHLPCSLLAGFAAMVMHLGWSIGFWDRIVRGPGAGFVRSLGDGRELAGT